MVSFCFRETFIDFREISSGICIVPADSTLTSGDIHIVSAYIIECSACIIVCSAARIRLLMLNYSPPS
jgi:ferredoxin-like protein FixX